MNFEIKIKIFKQNSFFKFNLNLSIRFYLFRIKKNYLRKTSFQSYYQFNPLIRRQIFKIIYKIYYCFFYRRILYQIYRRNYQISNRNNLENNLNFYYRISKRNNLENNLNFYYRISSIYIKKHQKASKNIKSEVI